MRASLSQQISQKWSFYDLLDSPSLFAPLILAYCKAFTLSSMVSILQVIMNTSTINPGRESRYCDIVRASIAQLGHATNAMIIAEVRKHYPRVSATTIHRVTTRLAMRGELIQAPADLQGAMRYETSKAAHDHFMCTVCGKLHDIDIAKEVTKFFEEKLFDCRPSGRVVVSGTCGACHPLQIK